MTTHWDLVRELATMQDRMNRMWGSMYERGQQQDTGSHGAWLPPVDIYETDDREIVLKSELPGLRREDIDLTVENNTLTFRGERQRDEGIRDSQYHRHERLYGTCSRSFTLPNTVDATKVRAEYRDGVLTVRMPLREEAKPRQIAVDAGR
jgi:HSP20 family protein